MPVPVPVPVSVPVPVWCLCPPPLRLPLFAPMWCSLDTIVRLTVVLCCLLSSTGGSERCGTVQLLVNAQKKRRCRCVLGRTERASSGVVPLADRLSYCAMHGQSFLCCRRAPPIHPSHPCLTVAVCFASPLLMTCCVGSAPASSAGSPNPFPAAFVVRRRLCTLRRPSGASA